MAKYNVIFSCGHEGSLNLIGPRKTREWRIKQAEESGLCPDCYAKYMQEKRERENKEAEQQAKEMELPQLEGSEKQVAWAIKLRNKFIERITEVAETKEKTYFEAHQKHSKKAERYLKTLDHILRTQTSAVFYIDNRNEYAEDIIDSFKEEYKKGFGEVPTEEMEVVAESTVSPKVIEHEEIIEITKENNILIAKCEKNEVARKIFKELKLNFNGRWERTIKETNGPIEDRIAELGNKLLNAGFRVCILDENIRNKAINADYECECTRWIKATKDKLVIRWENYDSELYNKAKSLPGAYWKDGRMLIGVCHYKEVQDFAELLEFKFTIAALNLIENYKKQILNVSTVEVANSKEHIDKDGLEEILNSSREVLNDLKEED